MSTETVVFYLDDDHEDLVFFKDAASEVNKEVSVITRTRFDELLNDLDNPPPAPFAVFLDLNMPRKNGIDVLADIRKNSKFDHIPIIILTTSNSPDVVDKTKELGANLFITKPTNFKDLKKAIKYSFDTDFSKSLRDHFFYNKS